MLYYEVHFYEIILNLGQEMSFEIFLIWSSGRRFKAHDSTSTLKALPGKLYHKRYSPIIYLIFCFGKKKLHSIISKFSYQ